MKGDGVTAFAFRAGRGSSGRVVECDCAGPSLAPPW